MSRSIWASAEHTTSARAERHGGGEHEQSALARVASSAKQCLLMVLVLVGLFELAIVPGAAAADSGSPISQPASRAVSSGEQASDSHQVVSLSFGTGVASRHGLRRVRVLQDRLARAGFVPGAVGGGYRV